MHELSVAHGIVEVVTGAARPLAPGPRARVTAVRVRVGALAGVVPEALAFCFDVAAAGTLLDGAALAIEPVPATVWCPACAATAPLADPTRLACPGCGRPTGALRGGRELEVADFTLDDGVDDEAAGAPPPAAVATGERP